MKPPKILKKAIVTDDANLAAWLTCVLAERGHYLPIIDGPRLDRPDWRDEVARRKNAIQRSKADLVLLANLNPDQDQAMRKILPDSCAKSVASEHEAFALLGSSSKRSPMRWGKDFIGVGLLQALRQGSLIRFDDGPSPAFSAMSGAKHLVLCEDDEDLSQVIAANYAFSIGADLIVFPAVDRTVADDITEGLYGIYDQRDNGPSEAIRNISASLRALCPRVEVPPNGSMTIITAHLPLGLAFPEVPCTHLPTHPDLGIAIVNGFSGDQNKIRCAVLVDPEETPAPEIDVIAGSFAKRRAFVRGYSGRGANVRHISDMVEFFPYDFLLISTHCGDASGHRWTYEFLDRSARTRRLTVDIALGVAHIHESDKLEVTEYIRFHELDGVDWRDPHKSDKIEIGTVIDDFLQLRLAPDELLPIKKETIPRVLGSAALRMADFNYIPIPRSLALDSSPIVFNNACASWHELSKRFMFAGARAYVGTLFPVVSTEAAAVASSAVENHGGQPLAAALWLAQNALYGESVRRPYVVVGVYPQSLRVKFDSTPTYLHKKLVEALKHWEGLSRMVPRDARTENKINSICNYLRMEIFGLKSRYSGAASKAKKAGRRNRARK